MNRIRVPWSRCDVCGDRSELGDVLRGWFRRGALTYPRRSNSGSRREVAVRSLCGRCESRAGRVRAEAGAAPVPVAALGGIINPHFRPAAGPTDADA